MVNLTRSNLSFRPLDMYSHAVDIADIGHRQSVPLDFKTFFY